MTQLYVKMRINCEKKCCFHSLHLRVMFILAGVFICSTCLLLSSAINGVMVNIYPAIFYNDMFKKFFLLRRYLCCTDHSYQFDLSTWCVHASKWTKITGLFRILLSFKWLRSEEDNFLRLHE